MLKKEIEEDFCGQTAMSKNNLNFEKSFSTNTVDNKLWKYAKKQNPIFELSRLEYSLKIIK